METVAHPVELLAKTIHGLEGVLADELRALGASNIKPGTRSVAFEGDTELMYRANVHLRTALRILKPIYQFEADSDDALYKAIYGHNWAQYFGLDNTFAIDAHTFGQVFTHSKFAALKTKDAIVDQFRNKSGMRPNIDTEQPDVRLNLHIAGTKATVSLDSSGDSLHKRGYRAAGHRAPLSEVLAAGMILLAGWDHKQPFVDPMCGSGTIVLEAALMALNMPPGMFRKRFGFHGWKDFDKELWKAVQKEAGDACLDEPTAELYASDVSGRSVGIAREAAEEAGLEHAIRFQRCDFLQLEPASRPGLMIMNPPYGERLDAAPASSFGRTEEDDVEVLYENIGTHLKHKWPGWDAWLISSNRDALKCVGLKAADKITLFNGPLECSFRNYALYQGSKKPSKAGKPQKSFSKPKPHFKSNADSKKDFKPRQERKPDFKPKSEPKRDFKPQQDRKPDGGSNGQQSGGISWTRKK